MRLKPASLLVIMTGFGVPASPASPPATTDRPVIQEKKQSSQKKAPATTSLAGCIDEQGGHYVLVDDRNLSPVADLEADGFPTEGFAKHLGQKVTVRGTSNSGSTRPVFKVRSIETISETCAPTPQSDKK